MKTFAAQTLCLGVALASVASARAEVSFYANGLGGLSCGKLLEATKSEVGRAQVADWLNGYVTGYNYYASKPLLPSDKESSIAFAETFCRNNPLSNIVSAAAVLVQDLGGPKVLFQYER
ncbi:MAG: hypothetical protein ACOH1R_09600 [Luteimonas sp.]